MFLRECIIEQRELHKINMISQDTIYVFMQNRNYSDLTWNIFFLYSLCQKFNLSISIWEKKTNISGH